MNLEGRLAVTAFVKGCETVGAGKARSHDDIGSDSQTQRPSGSKDYFKKSQVSCCM